MNALAHPRKGSIEVSKLFRDTLWIVRSLDAQFHHCRHRGLQSGSASPTAFRISSSLVISSIALRTTAATVSDDSPEHRAHFCVIKQSGQLVPETTLVSRSSFER